MSALQPPGVHVNVSHCVCLPIFLIYFILIRGSCCLRMTDTEDIRASSSFRSILKKTKKKHAFFCCLRVASDILAMSFGTLCCASRFIFDHFIRRVSLRRGNDRSLCVKASSDRIQDWNRPHPRQSAASSAFRKQSHYFV